MDLTPDGLAGALDAHELQEVPALPGRRNDQLAGVLVPVVWRGGPWALATARSRGLRSHAGEVCFPGGRPEAGDDDLFATACREAHEEVGLEVVRPLGRLSSMPVYTSEHRLEPFVAEVRDGPLRVNPGEVAEVLAIDLAALLTAPYLDAIPWDQDGLRLLSPVFTLGEHVMYGGTAHVLFELLSVVASAAGVELPPRRPGRYQWAELWARSRQARRGG